MIALSIRASLAAPLRVRARFDRLHSAGESWETGSIVSSASAKDKILAVLLPKATTRPDPPTVETVRLIVEEVGQDVAQLTAIMDRMEPLWNLEEQCRLYERQQTEETHL